MKTISLGLDKILPYKNNPRLNDAAIAPVMASLERYGYLTPIVVDKKHVIIVGHTRHEALKRLGHKKVRVIVADLTPEQAKEFRLVDNKTGELATWDKDRLVAELRHLEGDSMASFFKGNELKKLMGDLNRIGGDSPTQADIDKADKAAQGHFTNLANNLAEGVIECTCGHCGKKFSFDVV